MWLLLAFLSATLLGFYDVFKKKSLKDNAVLPVLFLNTFFSSLIFLPFILISVYQPDLLEEQYSMFPLLVGNSINILSSSRLSCCHRGYSVTSE